MGRAGESDLKIRPFCSGKLLARFLREISGPRKGRDNRRVWSPEKLMEGNIWDQLQANQAVAAEPHASPSPPAGCTCMKCTQNKRILFTVQAIGMFIEFPTNGGFGLFGNQ